MISLQDTPRNLPRRNACDGICGTCAKFGRCGAACANAKESKHEIVIGRKIRDLEKLESYCCSIALHDVANMISDRRPDPFEKLFLNQRPVHKDPERIPINIKEVHMPSLCLTRRMSDRLASFVITASGGFKRLYVPCRQPRHT